MGQQPAGKRASQDERQRNAKIEDTGRACALLRGEPIGQIKQDARIETGLANAEQKTQRVEDAFRMSEHHGGGDDTPRNHDPAQPEACADLVHDDVAGNFKKRISDKEYAGSECIGSIT